MPNELTKHSLKKCETLIDLIKRVKAVTSLILGHFNDVTLEKTTKKLHI